MAAPPYNVLALCAGIGGLERGIALAEPHARTVCYVERDPYAACVLAARMADGALDPAPIWDDLSTFDARPWSGVVDCVAGGFPCQAHSTAGKRLGIDDKRWLWDDFARVIAECEPRYVFIENVPGLLISSGGGAFRAVLESLAALGYDAEWVCIRASDVGAPHRRERIFMLAHAYVRGLEGERRSRLLDGERATQRDDTDGCNGAWAVGDADEPRLEGRSGAFGGSADQRAAWPPAPADHDGWARWLAAGGPAPATEPGVRGSADGPSTRMDRLRCLGNAVVPAQAALAWRVLMERE